jgi:diguanylate cyclase
MLGPMTKDTLFLWLFRVFALNQRRDYVIKPLGVTTAFLAMYSAVMLLILRQPLASLPGLVLTAGLVQLPFTALAFTMLTYMNRMQIHLAELAMTDVLTGLPNRRAFVAQAGRAQAGGHAGFMLIIDADHFKRINDTYGHAVGDRCLQAIAKRLNDVRRPEDLIGRIGGEEFGAYLPYCTMQEIDQLGKKLCNAILINLPDLPVPLRLTMSVGAAETRPDEMIEAALSRADEALYAAKASGRARLIVWTRSAALDVA